MARETAAAAAAAAAKQIKAKRNTQKKVKKKHTAKRHKQTHRVLTLKEQLKDLYKEGLSLYIFICICIQHIC